MRRELLALVILFGAGCSSSSTPDASVLDSSGPPIADAAIRPDAAVVPNEDATPRPDALPGQDATADDDAATTPNDDAAVANNPDAMPIDPCGPVPRAQGVDRLGTALTAWLARCNPELSVAEATLLATGYAATQRGPFDDLALTYDPTAGGRCGCAIEAAPCDTLGMIKAVPSCERVFVGTATIGDLCNGDYFCGENQYCGQGRVEVSGGGGPLPICVGFCLPLIEPGGDCSDSNARCTPGYYCDFTQQAGICEPKALLGEDCSESPCVGDREDVLIFPPNYCRFTKSGATCEARGRGPSGDCIFESCHDLYTCQQDSTCTLDPGLGQACTLSIDVVTPDFDQRQQLILDSFRACRVDHLSYCTQTGTTTGDGTCVVPPATGQACGIGAGLVPYCLHGSYCDGIDSQTLADITAVCSPGLTVTSTCTFDFISGGLNDQCAGNSYCTAIPTPKGAFETRCVEMCFANGSRT